jgi:hypothetical protein
MAGRVRQPIDVEALEQYLTKHVPEIKGPLQIEQVWAPQNKAETMLLLSD